MPATSGSSSASSSTATGEPAVKKTVHEDYIREHINPVLESLVTELLVEKPENSLLFMIRHLCELANIPDVTTRKTTDSTAADCGGADGDDKYRNTLSVKAVEEMKQELETLKMKVLRHSNTNTGSKSDVEAGTTPGDKNQDEEEDDEDDEDDDDYDVGDLPDIFLHSDNKTLHFSTKDDSGDVVAVQRYNTKSRHSVSAEAYGSWNTRESVNIDTSKHLPKTVEQRERISEMLKQSFLFRSLEDADIRMVIAVMNELVLDKDMVVIEEGEDGDMLYVVEKGACDCRQYIKDEPQEETASNYKEPAVAEKLSGCKVKSDRRTEKSVKVFRTGDAFGELALLYNCPRTASVITTEDNCILWTLDRLYFNKIVSEAASKKRNMYDKFLSSVPILETITQWERAKLADALKKETFNKNDVIVKQGDKGNTFYIIEEGTAVATRSYVPGTEANVVMQYQSGDYFGELALLKNEPRAANVIARSDKVVVVGFDRKCFNRILGPLKEILINRAAEYKNE